MKTKIALLLSSLTAAAVFTGCGQEVHDVSIPTSIPTIPTTTLSTRGHEIILNGMKGPYPEPIINKKLGDGLLNNYYEKIKKYILMNLLDPNAQVKIKFISNKKSANISKIKKGLKEYFSTQDKFLTIFDGPADAVVKILEDGNVITFAVILKNPNKFTIQPPKYIKVNTPLNVLEKDAASPDEQEWSTVKIPTKYGNVITYQIMKRPVLISQYYPDKMTVQPRAVTQISFDDADEWCAKKYGGQIATLYVFEYALRQGKILYATNFYATKEMVAAYDPANPEDTQFKKAGDIVSLVKDKCEKLDEAEKIRCYANEDYSNILIFNYETMKYENMDDSYQSLDTTFRCVRRGGK